MASYFRKLVSYAATDRVAVVDPIDASRPPRNHTYSHLLTRLTVFRERFITAAEHNNKELFGARIGLLAPPGLDFVAALLSVWSVGAIVVPICSSHPPLEMAHTVNDSDQDFIIYHSSFRSKIQPLMAGRTCIDISQIPAEAVPQTTLDFTKLGLADENPGIIIYTSGTTGPPKGVVHTGKSYAFLFDSLAEAWQMTSEDRILHTLPLHHGHGLLLSLLLPLWTGATVEFVAKFNENLIWGRMMDPTRPPITVFMAVPTIWVRMIAHYDRNYKDDPVKATKATNAACRLRLAISGSAALPAPIRDAWSRIAKGYLLLERYGMTETGITHSERLADGGRIQGSVGWPLPGVRSRLIAADGRDVTDVPDIMGEIQVQSGGQMQEYWRKPGAAEKDITPDGWWRTGDLALTRATHPGAYFIQGRASTDIIKSGGFKISGLDIETALLHLPFVEEVAVVGVPDPVWGEAVAAVCVPVEGKAAELTMANIRECLRSELAAYKLPQKLRVLEKLPRNAMGKVQKKALREQCFPQQRSAKL
ncbi:Acyl-CoA synthetase family member 3, mitochondrial [Cyphellophora attinorum]|uniref:Acyl-CoA synthetase family member 3, mitochondrial n=1 Tax=Cyphellophora attinorum TaxID=1664694 RepID=A0A0N0NKX8_9EURO|nr:Acyl-CoA synthetase family member 3, mitochondrial [Phialophora attinorum]KPI38359.1 Acyl-CoA synthetase family member 3, mitochondrial [Phialophora attinorum]